VCTCPALPAGPNDDRTDLVTTTLPTSIDPRTAAGILEHWGFLAHSDLPDRAGPSYLLVAIRPKPTLAHYDPEEIEYWVTDSGRGIPATLGRLSRLPVDAQTTWGMVRVTDRLRETNEWLSFGGRLQAEVVSGAIVAVLTSSAPLLRRGGHSQGWDEGAPSVAAFFAKVRAAAGYDHRFETLEAAAEPLARYGCFVADFARRYRHSEVLRNLDPELWRTVQREEHRMKDGNPAEWESGLRLLAALDASSTSQLMGDAPHPL
jgi:hypothetical protein